MALEKLRDDDGVVQDRIRSQAMIFLERHDEARQVVTGDRVDRDAVTEELPEAVEHGFIFAMSVGLFQRCDLLLVFSDGDVQCRFPCIRSRQSATKWRSRWPARNGCRSALRPCVVGCGNTGYWP